MKVQKISGFQHQFSLNFIENDFESFKQRFFEGDLGKICQAFSWSDLLRAFLLKHYSKGLLSSSMAISNILFLLYFVRET